MFNITRIEALDQTNGSSTSYIQSIKGGLNTFHVTISFRPNYENPSGVDFVVNIFGEPIDELPFNDYIVGEHTNRSRLVTT